MTASLPASQKPGRALTNQEVAILIGGLAIQRVVDLPYGEFTLVFHNDEIRGARGTKSWKFNKADMEQAIAIAGGQTQAPDEEPID